MTRSLTSLLMLVLFVLGGSSSSLQVVKLVVHIADAHISHDHASDISPADKQVHQHEKNTDESSNETQHSDHSHDNEICYYSHLIQMGSSESNLSLTKKSSILYDQVFSYSHSFSSEYLTSVFRPPIYS